MSPANKGKPYELDILSPIEDTYQNNNLFHFPEAYERLENIVKAYPADKFNLIDANTKFTIESEYSSCPVPPRYSSLSIWINNSQATYNRHFKGLSFCLQKAKK